MNEGKIQEAFVDELEKIALVGGVGRLIGRAVRSPYSAARGIKAGVVGAGKGAVTGAVSAGKGIRAAAKRFGGGVSAGVRGGRVFPKKPVPKPTFGPSGRLGGVFPKEPKPTFGPSGRLGGVFSKKPATPKKAPPAPKVTSRPAPRKRSFLGSRSARVGAGAMGGMMAGGALLSRKKKKSA